MKVLKKNWHDFSYFDKPKETEDWWPVVPEAHDLSGAAGAHYLGRIMRLPIEWMYTPLDVVNVPEASLAFGEEPHVSPPPGEEPTYSGMLAQLGRQIGETGRFGSIGSAEDPWVGQDLTPEIMETLVPMAAELSVGYPLGIRGMHRAGATLVEGIEGVLARAAEGYERLARPVGEAYRYWYSRNILPRRLESTAQRLTALGEEAVAGVEWWRDVNEAQKLAMLDEAEKQITHTLSWVEGSLAAEDEMAMNLAIEAQGRVPPMPGPGGAYPIEEPGGIDLLGPGAGQRVEGRVPPTYMSGRFGPFEEGPQTTADILERLSEREPSRIVTAETPDPYAYMDATTRRQLETINMRNRATINAAMNRAKARATAEQKELLNELEAAGVDLAADTHDLPVDSDRFTGIKRRFEDNMGTSVPPKLVTDIHERQIPELIGDSRYTKTSQSLKRRQSMADALNEGLPKGSGARITAEEIAQAGKDPNLREKLAKLMSRRIRNSPYYKNKEQGFMEMSLLIRLGEMGIGAVTGGAMDEENRLRGAVVGALVAFTLGTVLRFGKGLGTRGAVEVGGKLDDILRDAGFFEREIAKGVSKENQAEAMAGKVFQGSQLVPVTEEMIAAKQRALDEILSKIEFAKKELPKYPDELIGTSEAGKFLYSDTRAATKSDVMANLERMRKDAQWGVDRLKRQYERGKSVLSNERGAWNIRQMQEKAVRASEIEGPESIRQPQYTKAEAKARGARREVQNKMFGKAMGAGMGRDGLRAWIIDTYGKPMSELTEAEMVLADQDLTRRIALSRLFPEGQLDRAVRVRNVEDLAMELYGTRAQKKINAAVRKVVGQHRDLWELNQHDLTSVLEILPKRFLRTRGLGALIRQPLAVEDVLNRMGSWGKFITRQIRRERRHTDYLWAKWFTPLREEIRGLTDGQLQEIVAALHPMEANGRQIVMPQDPRLQRIALRIRQDLNEIGHLRQEIGDPVRLADGSTRPFEMMDNYYPLHIPPDELTSSIKIKRRIIEHLMETGQASGPSEALTIYDEFIRRTVTNRFGNLDYAREAWVEPEKFDLLKDLSRYYYGSARRISRYKYYGSTGSTQLPEKMTTWLDALRQDVGPDEFQYAHQAISRHFVHEAVDDAMSDMLKRIRSFETLAHMGLAQIMNSSEPVHTAVFTGFHNFAKGFARAIRSTSVMDARELVARNGAAVGSTIRDLFGSEGGAGSLTAKFLRVTGFSPIETWNRKLAAHAGIQYIESTVSKLLRNPESTRLRGMLDEVLLNPNEILARGGITDEELIKGAMELSNRTQKRTGVIDLPLFMSHPMGRIVTMFKTFAYGSARLMVRDFLLGARHNPERLLRLLVAFPIVGEIVGDVRNLMTGNVRDTEGLARLAENFAYVGTLGIAYDFFRSIQFGEGSIKSFMVGPVGSDIAQIMDGTYSWLAEGKGRKLGKQALRMLPPPATILRGKAAQKYLFGREFFPPPTKRWQL